MSGLSGRGVSVGDRVVYQGTFASAPTSAVTYDEAIFTDVGIAGSKFFWDGSAWKPVNGSVVWQGSRYPILIAPTGTFNSGATGNVTFGTTLTNTYSGGLWVYLPTNASAGTTAGFYFVTMSSATVGTITGTSQSVPNNSPDTTTAFTVPGGGPFAFTGDITEITSWTWSIPANLLGASWTLWMEGSMFKNPTSTSQPTCRLKLGTTAGNSYTSTTAMGVGRFQHGFRGNATNKQFALLTGNGQTSSANPAITTVDTTAATTLNVTLQHPTTATDFVGLYAMELRIEI